MTSSRTTPTVKLSLSTYEMDVVNPRANPTSRPCLLLLSGAETGRLVPWPQEQRTLLIGRGQDTDLRLPFPEISRHHARLTWGDDGLFVEDLQSTNGTFVQGVATQQRQPLAHGMRLQMGWCLLKLLWLDEDEREVQTQMFQESSRDALTGLINRRHFHELLTSEWSYARRHQQPISLLLLDLDHFKRFNKREGHIQGDQLLLAAAKRLQSLIRCEDILARYDGDLFALILRETPLSGTTQQAERIRANFATSALLKHTSSPVVTLSLGATCISPAAQDEETSLLEETQRQLRLAKEQGRNQLRAHAIHPLRLEPPPSDPGT